MAVGAGELSGLPPGYELRGARDDEIAEITRAAESVFGQFGAPREYFLARYRNYPGAAAEHSRVVLHRGRVVAHQRLYRHELALAGAVIPVWALGDVFTLPAHRRLGLGRALGEDGALYLRRLGCPLLLVRTSTYDFYEALGFERIGLPRLTLDVASFPLDALPEGEWVTRSYEEPYDLWPVALVHERFNEGRSLVRQRDRHYWANHRIWCGSETSLSTVVAENGGRVVAYARVWPAVGSSRAWHAAIHEFCYLPGEEAAAVSVLRRCLYFAATHGMSTLTATLPRDHAAWAAVRGLPGVREEEDDETMLCLLDLRGLFERLLDRLSARLRSAATPLSSPITLRCQGQSVTLLPEGGYLALGRGEGRTRAVDLSQKQLLEFCAGLSQPGDALGLEGQVARELDAMFPLGSPVYWTSDEV